MFTVALNQIIAFSLREKGLMQASYGIIATGVGVCSCGHTSDTSGAWNITIPTHSQIDYYTT